MRHALLAAAAALLLSACGAANEGGTMRPGSDCLSCHAGGGDAPRFTAAGTVFAGGNSTAGVAGATVTITPSSGPAVHLTTNSVGNFFTSAALPAPLTVSVSAGGFTNAMSGTASSGACGSCHKPAGVAAARVHVGNCAGCHV